jgi:RNA polymerase sigma factor (TIGR02999 family)
MGLFETIGEGPVRLASSGRSANTDRHCGLGSGNSYGSGMILCRKVATEKESVEITRLLGEIRGGNRAAESQLMEAVFPELKRRAANFMRSEDAKHTLQATALVNEIYLELAGRADGHYEDRIHFFATASLAMRRFLTDYARAKKSKKRGGERAQVELKDCMAISEDHIDEAIAVHGALDRMAEWDPRCSKVVELRYFGGLTEDEVAAYLKVSSKTVKRDWGFARAWLRGELAGQAAASTAQ